MIILATGISGTGKLEYLRSVAQEAGDAEIFDVGEKMFEKSRQLGIEIPEGKILDLDTYALHYLRAAVFEELLKQLNQYRGASSKDLVISTHACFRWKKHLIPAFNFYYLNHIRPDLYITVLENAQTIKARLEQGKWRGRLTLKDVLVWRDEETFITQMLAQYQRKPFYIISRNEPPSLLLKIIRDVEKPKLAGQPPKALRAYLSYPITHVIGNPEFFEEKERVKQALRQHGLVIYDPITIEEADVIMLAEEAKSQGKQTITVEADGGQVEINVEEVLEAADDIYDQIVARDYMLIDQSDMIIVYYPTTVVSPGVLNEINYGFTHNKDVYAIFPHRVSPFLKYYTTCIFKNVEELIEYLKE
ncbi:MAG: hypothetical protein DRJ44_07545 [Thermoprotei archaeon]|nr:MAG: hypothetical protein DRJ44_07545 [Thermoprotei archaeon]